MRLYHYAPLKNSVLKEGLISFAHGYGDGTPYVKRAGNSDRERIISWMEKCFPGRSRALSVITEPIKWKGNDPMLREFIKEHAFFSFELNDLIRDGIIDSVWCQDGNKLYPVQPAEIDVGPLPWEKCDQNKGLFFGVIRHYFIVLKKGALPPQYIREEKINLS